MTELDRPPAPEPLARPVVDSHCHLDMGFNGDALPVADALAMAAAANVTRIVQIGCDVAGSRWSAEMAAQHADVLAFVALHANEAPRIASEHGRIALDEAYAHIEALIALPHVTGIGETGLDHFRTDSGGLAVQEESFRRHIGWAKKYDKPLAIHDRDAHRDVLRVLEDEGAPRRVIFHCYSGDAEMAVHCAAMGWFLSYAGVLTFKNAQDRRDALLATPLESILVETDAPFLTPTPYRGRPNASYLVPHTVRAIAELRGIEEAELCDLLWDNTSRAIGAL